MPYRVIVVDDSAFMRKIISDLIEQEPSFQVQATAKNGREAIGLIESLNPDLVTMDVEMPEMNGLEALKLIMERKPLPVIMLSGINEQGMRETIMALELGAFDFIRKPSASTSSHDIEQVGQQLREQIRVAMAAKERKAARNSAISAKLPEILPPRLRKPTPGSKAKSDLFVGRSEKEKPAERAPAKNRLAEVPKPLGEVSAGRAERDKKPEPKTGPGKAIAKEQGGSAAKPRSSAGKPANMPLADLSKSEEDAKAVQTAVSQSAKSPIRANFSDLVAIGTSTGGPKALKAVLEKLPAGFPAPIVIVQHMPPNFTKSLAQRLNSLCELSVLEAEEGMRLEAGTAYIAPGGKHMNVISGPDGTYRLSLTEQEPRNGHRPSVDVMYDSLIPLKSLRRHAVLLTGMGSDGAKSMKKLYDSGVTSTIAESEETCVVYGMPRSAVELGCVAEILPLHEIGNRLTQVVK
ncbi:chemotaxis-specific protein-glutamate methyltransferase CheB [Paenibacillus sp. DYY-L-2]|uniref:protein-glutamate methylesterase/protein-glutamine glutaminase n=1 Tax=Paenibacillus sp. DYY-L-2 TaxID=3447013 RepID=UPI003F504F38